MKELLYLIFCFATAVISYHMHGDSILALISFFFAPLVWLKWLVCQDINITIIKESFSFFFR